MRFGCDMGITVEDTARARLIIAVSIIEQLNGENHTIEGDFWQRFATLYDERVGDGDGINAAALIREITQKI
jgi:hypothetical protein